MINNVILPVPADTSRLARSVFGRGNPYLATGDQLRNLLTRISLSKTVGLGEKSAKNLVLLHLVTIFQYVETLSDQQASDALRLRTEWKYALHLPLEYPGLEPGIFCEFRSWLKGSETAQQDLKLLILRISEIPGFSRQIHPGILPMQLITSVCQYCRLARVWDIFKQALEALALARPEWLLSISLPHWYGRYSNGRRYLYLYAEKIDPALMAESIGSDGHYLLGAVSAARYPELQNLPQVLVLRQLWCEEFECGEDKPVWRKNACLGCDNINDVVFSKPSVNDQDREVGMHEFRNNESFR